MGTIQVDTGDVNREDVIRVAKLKLSERLGDIEAVTTENVIYVEGRILNFVVKDSVQCK